MTLTHVLEKPKLLRNVRIRIDSMDSNTSISSISSNDSNRYIINNKKYRDLFEEIEQYIVPCKTDNISR